MKYKIKRLLSLLLSLMMLTAALPTSIWAEESGLAQATGAEAELPNEPEATTEPELPSESPETTAEPELPSEPTNTPAENELPENTTEPTPQVTEEPLPTPETEAAYQSGMFVLVTENTRVFLDVDETADAEYGELYDGNFVRAANVRVEEVRQDGMGRTWLLIRYLYGEEEPSGEMAWTDTATVWVLAEETQPSDAAEYNVTAYAFPFTPVELYAADTPPRLQTLSGNTGEFYAGQFAIREVIKQLEGSQYVRDYWRMDDFYRATGQAPKEYLEYARWLAANALTYAQMTGEITVSNVSVSVANGVWLGHSDFSTTANIYAHLDYQSKISSAEAMLTGLGMS